MSAVSGPRPIEPSPDSAPAPEPAPEPPPEPEWLAAYALGIAYAALDTQQRIEHIWEVAAGCPDLLEAAVQRLDLAMVAEPDLRDRARELLDQVRGLHAAGVAAIGRGTRGRWG